VPVLEQAACGRCGGRTHEVKITPPGDARPAFDSDIERARVLIDEQFGAGTGLTVLPPGHIVLLNKAPDLDRTDEVIVSGEVVGALRFDLVKGEQFLLRPASAIAIAPRVERGWVKIDPGAAEAIRERSASTLAVGISDCDPSITPGMEVLVLDPSGSPVSVGTAKMSATEMMEHRRGTAVKTRWIVQETKTRGPDAKAGWSDVLEANQEVISRRSLEARRFIEKTVQANDLPVAVSYSGGKDSLATLLLVLEAGLRPKLLFVDTGLEFEETLQNVQETAETYSLEVVKESAGDAFWTNLEHFGPPAKDYRWCCKTCKLGPATRLIEKNFEGGVLSFIGQRAYESEQRAKKGSVWRNPWTPNQLAASPIQKWTALHVWLYLMSKGARASTLYEKGLERIGCFMCPATDLEELRRVREISPQYKRWQNALDNYSRNKGLPQEWLKYDLWRWRRVPKPVLDELGMSSENLEAKIEARASTSPLVFKSTSGYNPCLDGLSMEGVFNAPLDMMRVANMLNMIGEVTTSPDGGIAEVERITVFAEGPAMIKAKDEKELTRKAAHLKEVVFRAMECAGCGICVARCKKNALKLDGRVCIDVDLCDHCGSCFGPCPVIKFREDELDI
jgi:phosphoadenosine phosphosulfate reductase